MYEVEICAPIKLATENKLKSSVVLTGDSPSPGGEHQRAENSVKAAEDKNQRNGRAERQP